MSRRKRKRTPLPQRPDPARGSRRRIKASHVLVIATILAGIVVASSVSRWSRFGSDSVPSKTVHVDDSTESASVTDSQMVPRLSATSWQDLDNPSRDGWDSEVFSAQADEQLKKLSRWLSDGTLDDPTSLTTFAIEDSHCGPLRPEHLVSVYEDATVRVERAPSRAMQSPESYRKRAGLAAALRSLRRPFDDARNVRSKFKLFRVTPSSDGVTTRQYFSMSGHQDNRAIELHATWTIHWRQDEPGDMPRLAWIGVEDYEQVVAQSTSPTLFSDCTASVLASNACYGEQLLRGFNHWLDRSQDHQFNFLLGNPGIAVGDANGDGLDDLYVCQEAGLPNLLFLQKSDGTAEDVSERAGVDWLDNSKCALFVDLDNDGDQDLVVALNGGVALAANDGQARFVLRTVLDSSDDCMSLSAVDYNRDGRLDLYAGVYHRGVTPDDARQAAIAAASAGVVYHDANNGGANSLFRNDTRDSRSWAFTDVTRQVGLEENNRRFTLAAAWEDFDNDGDQDLYVANDFGRNNLYRNDTLATGEQRFVDVSPQADAEDSASGMSVTWGDYDRDGWMDVYVSNMFSAAGNRITFQDRFKADAPARVKTRLQRFARGNTLLRNLGKEKFADVSDATGVTMGRWAWSSIFTDLNNDGWEDLIVANGYITGSDTDDL